MYLFLLCLENTFGKFYFKESEVIVRWTMYIRMKQILFKLAF